MQMFIHSQQAYKAYHAALERLPISNPTIEDWRAIAPHLTDAQIAQIQESEEDFMLFAAPPLKVRYGYQVISFSKGGGRDPQLDTFGARRTPKSYAHWENGDRTYGDLFTPTLFQDEAIAFAENHWRSTLVFDNWVDYGITYLQDPTDRDERGSPKTTHVIYWTTKRSWSDIGQDVSKPQSSLWEDALWIVTFDPFIGKEVKGGRGTYADSNCSICGGGLGMTSCFGCSEGFSDNGIRSGHQTPLPPIVVRKLQQAGHTFRVHPSVARDRERRNWEIARSRPEFVGWLR